MLDLPKRRLFAQLYKMHGKMLFYSAIWGLLTGIVVLIACRQGQFTFAKATMLVIGFGFLSWLTSLAAPTTFQVYKYVLPITLTLLGAALWGLAGMIVGYAISFFLRIIGDFRGFFFMVTARGRGPDPTQYKPTRDIVARPMFGFVVACAAIAMMLFRAGVEWGSSGSGEFATIIDPSMSGKLAQLPVFCLILNFTRQLFESGIDIWTTPTLWSVRR